MSYIKKGDDREFSKDYSNLHIYEGGPHVYINEHTIRKEDFVEAAMQILAAGKHDEQFLGDAAKAMRDELGLSKDI